MRLRLEVLHLALEAWALTLEAGEPEPDARGLRTLGDRA
jgi:hypothetical protein